MCVSEPFEVIPDLIRYSIMFCSLGLDRKSKLTNQSDIVLWQCEPKSKENNDGFDTELF